MIHSKDKEKAKEAITKHHIYKSMIRIENPDGSIGLKHPSEIKPKQ